MILYFLRSCRRPLERSLWLAVLASCTFGTPAAITAPAQIAQAAPPAIDAIMRTTVGYAVIGSGFGTDPRRVLVAENNRVLSRFALLGVSDERIDVSSPLPAAATIAVKIGALSSTGFVFRAAAHPPAVTAAIPTPRGYTVVGTGFGADPRRVVVIENDAVVPPASIASLTDTQIVVRSRTPGNRSVAVQVAGATSRRVRVPAALQPAPAGR